MGPNKTPSEYFPPFPRAALPESPRLARSCISKSCGIIQSRERHAERAMVSKTCFQKTASELNGDEGPPLEEGLRGAAEAEEALEPADPEGIEAACGDLPGPVPDGRNFR